MAKLHSKAVDYIKSGKPAVMQRHLQPRKWPHWMERDKKSYQSNSALGQIYDRVKVGEFHAAYEMPFDVRIDVAMRRLMGQHEAPVSEFEIWTTFILSKPRVGSDYKLQENVGREMAALKERFRTECKTAVAGNTGTQGITFSSSMVNLEKLDRFVAAMYTVTNNEVRAVARERLISKQNDNGGQEGVQMPLISFPWLFHRELARVALGRDGDVRPLKAGSEDLTLDDGELGVPGDAVSPDAVGPAEVTQPAQWDSAGSATERGDSAAHGETGRDYVRTSGGQVVHRGQMLTLFTEPGEQIHTQQDTTAHIPPTARSISNNSMVADDSTGSSAPASPRTANRSEEEDECVEFEEMGDDDQDEEEDALEVLARKLGM